MIGRALAVCTALFLGTGCGEARETVWEPLFADHETTTTTTTTIPEEYDRVVSVEVDEETLTCKLEPVKMDAFLNDAELAMAYNKFVDINRAYDVVDVLNNNPEYQYFLMEMMKKELGFTLVPIC